MVDILTDLNNHVLRVDGTILLVEVISLAVKRNFIHIKRISYELNFVFCGTHLLNRKSNTSLLFIVTPGQ